MDAKFFAGGLGVGRCNRHSDPVPITVESALAMMNRSDTQ